MNIREIEYVLAIVSEGSISKAAQSLYMAQSSLSQSVQGLESRLGCKLFNRSGGRIHLTYAGERFVESGIKILKLYRDMENELYDIAHINKGSISIGLPMFMGSYLFSKFGPYYLQQYPGISVDIVEAHSSDLERLILSGKVDIAILPLPISSSVIYSEPVLRNRMTVMLSSNHPLGAFSVQKPGDRFPTIDLRQLSSLNFFMSKGQKMQKATMSIFQKAGISPEIKIVSQDVENLKSLVSMGMGFTILPEYHAEISKESVPLSYYYIEEQYDYPWTIVVAYRQDSYISDAARGLLRLLQEKFGVGKESGINPPGLASGPSGTQ